jgi:Uncharacterized protein conserved in bacteria (DUF2330)
MIRSRATLVCGMALLLLAGQVDADGAYFSFHKEVVGRSTQLVASPKQEAVLATDGERVQVVLRTHFRAGPQELAWVVPVPAKPTDIRKVDDYVFTKLEEITAPRFYRMVSSSGPRFHCGCARSGGERASLEQPLVRVEESGAAGIFDYVVLAADDPDALSKWLKENEYHVPEGAEPVFKRYVEQQWHWLAMKVRPEASEQNEVLAPHPISYTYRSDDVVFPLVISRLSADRETEVVLYVVGTTPFLCSNWGNVALDEMQVEHVIRQMPNAEAKANASLSGTNYEELLRLETTRKEGHLFVTEFCRRWELFGYSGGRGRRVDDVVDVKLVDSLAGRQTLTRLRAYVAAESMDQDVALTGTHEWRQVDNSVHVAITSGGAHVAALGPIPMAVLLSCGAFVAPRRRKSSRALRRACLALVCVVACMA